MKKIVIILLAVLVLKGTSAFGINYCQGNPVVLNWIEDRDKDAMTLIRGWLTGKPKETIAALIGLVWASETKIVAGCNKNTEFLKRNLILYGDLPFPVTVDTAPPLILRHFLKEDLLSPEIQYREKDKKEVKHDTQK